jgi:hypothetical protein
VIRVESELGCGEGGMTGIVHERPDQVTVAALSVVGRRSSMKHVQPGQWSHPVQRRQCCWAPVLSGVDDPQSAQQLPAGSDGEGKPAHPAVG